MIKKIIEKYKNYHPSKWEALSYLLIPIFIGLLTSTATGGDIWFIMNTGRYILNNGFPTIDPFTIHDGLSVVIQQWIPDIIFYKSFDVLGKTGIYLTVNLLNIYIVFITYKLLMLVSDKKRNLSVLITCIITTIYSLSFTIARPQMFSTSILITELYFLEKYFKTLNWKYLISLPILSILMINMHASMWLMLFCFWLTFFLNTFSYKIGKIKSEKRNKKELLIFGILMMLCGLVNPYGYKAMTYVLTSFGIPEINTMVSEMNVPQIQSVLGLAIYIIIFSVYCIYMLFNKKEINSRHAFLLAGTTYLSIAAYRGYLFFLIGSIYPLAIYFNEKFYYINENKFNKKIYSLLILIVLLIIIPLTIVIKNKYIIFENPKKKAIDYIYKNENEKQNIKIYCAYGGCDYSQWLGMKTYIDNRAEIFLKANNKKKDIFKEYYNLQYKKMYYKDFLEKYNFDYLIIDENDYLYQLMVNDKNDNYEIVYSSISDKINYKKFVASDDRFYYVVLKRINV